MPPLVNIPARPILRRVDAWIKNHSEPIVRESGEIEWIGGETAFAERMGWKDGQGWLARIREQEFMTHRLADKIICTGLGDPWIWLSVPELRRVYRRPIPVGTFERDHMDEEEREAERAAGRARAAIRRANGSPSRPRKEVDPVEPGSPTSKVKTCIGCQRSFEPDRPNKLYHSENCRRAAMARRKRRRLKEAA